MKTLKSLVLALVVLFSAPAHSAGYSPWAVPTEVEIVNGGVLISGAFGDPHSGGQTGVIYVAGTNTRFKEIVGMAYAALTAGREVRFYSNTCVQVSFHWAGNVINQNGEGQAAMMR